VEVDVHTCAEGVPVVIHDSTLEGSTDGSGGVHTTPLATLRTLNAAAKHVGWPQREPVPTLEEVVQETRGRILLVIEIKRVDIEAEVVEVIRVSGAVDDVMVWSFHPQVVAQFRERQPSIPAALLAHGEGWPDTRQLFHEALRSNAQACSIHHSMLTPGIAQAARRQGLGPYTWTVNDEGDMRRALECGVTGIVTDYPERLIALLDRRDEQRRER
jgi:glycerophosphoryl diester phosphodiesterase